MTILVVTSFHLRQNFWFCSRFFYCCMIWTHTDILIAAFVASVSAARQQPQNKPSSDQKKGCKWSIKCIFCHNTNCIGISIVKEIPLPRSPLNGITFNLDANTQNPLLALPHPSTHPLFLLSPPSHKTHPHQTTPLCFTSCSLFPQ